MKVSIDMGTSSSGQPAILDLEELLATRLLVQGNSGSGKSHLLRRLIEQGAPWVQQAIIDPEGDFVTLAEKFGHIVVDASAHTEAALQRIADRVRQHRVSVVLNLEGLDAELQMRHAAAFLGGLFDADRDYWYPVLVVVDEAQLFAPSVAGEVSDEARKVSLGAMTNLMCRGRKRGLAGVIATQRLAKLAKNVAAEASNFLMGRTFLDIDMARAADLLGMERKQAEMFRDLERGHFIALGPAVSRRPLPIRIGVVETAARSTSPRLMPVPEMPREEARDLILKAGESEAPLLPRRPPPPAPPATSEILLQLAQARTAQTAQAQAEEAAAAPERGAVLDEILRQVVADPEAPYRSVAVLYQDFLVRCRSYNVNGRAVDLPTFRRKLAAARAGIATGAVDSPEWEQAVNVAAGLSEDIQGVFLLLARAAMDLAPCPSDGAIARACGSRSPGRARRLLTYMEQRGFIVTRSERDGRRVITLPDLGWETAPGNPHAADEPPASGAPDLFEVA
ncbi:MAG TPA: ATP-binding protein [Azospirillaceae bacterium]|nr:ATP-binding protein [Azospirillaceae bacterium]